MTVSVTAWTLVLLTFAYPLLRQVCLAIARYALGIAHAPRGVRRRPVRRTAGADRGLTSLAPLAQILWSTSSRSSSGSMPSAIGCVRRFPRSSRQISNAATEAASHAAPRHVATEHVADVVDREREAAEADDERQRHRDGERDAAVRVGEHRREHEVERAEADERAHRVPRREALPERLDARVLDVGTRSADDHLDDRVDDAAPDARHREEHDELVRATTQQPDAGDADDHGEHDRLAEQADRLEDRGSRCRCRRTERGSPRPRLRRMTSTARPSPPGGGGGRTGSRPG